MPDLFGHTRTIKVISLWQPWASLMAAGVKLDETRHWSTAYRGPIAIHAAKRLDVAGSPDALCAAALGRDWTATLPLGALVAIGNLTKVRPAEWAMENATRANLAAGNFGPGRFAWNVERLRPLAEPIPLAGRQGLFNWEPPADIEALLRAAVDHRAACAAIGWT